jgi:Lon-like protease
VVVLAVVAAVAGALYVIPSDHYLVLPDRARPADPLVRVPGEKKGDDSAGGIYMVDVLIRKASVLERIFPGIEEGSSLVPAEQVNPVGVSDEQRRQSSLNEMSRSQQVAAAVALRSLGRKVEIKPNGVEVTLIRPGFPAEGKLEIGDVIVRANGTEIRTFEGLQNVMLKVEPGEDVQLVVDRGDTRKKVTVGTRANPENPERPVFGVQIAQSADIELPVAVRIEAGNIGGPSAGLAFALDIVDELGRDLDHGKTVVATGAIELSGKVDPIGGIQQKTIGARQAGADLFLVPDANAKEARRYADGLRIVAVSNFKEALAALATGA